MFLPFLLHHQSQIPRTKILAKFQIYSVDKVHQMMNIWGGGGGVGREQMTQLLRYLLHIYLNLKSS